MNSEMENLRSVAIIFVIFIWNHTLFLNRNSTITRLDDRKIGSKRNERIKLVILKFTVQLRGWFRVWDLRLGSPLSFYNLF